MTSRQFDRWKQVPTHSTMNTEVVKVMKYLEQTTKFSIAGSTFKKCEKIVKEVK